MYRSGRQEDDGDLTGDGSRRTPRVARGSGLAAKGRSYLLGPVMLGARRDGKE